MSLRRRVVGLIPPLAWRDAELRRRAALLSQMRADLRASSSRSHSRPVEQASFLERVAQVERHSIHLRDLDPQRRHPLRQLMFKLRTYRLAQSHGVPVPQVLAVWRSPADITTEGLPQRFVIKSDGGSGSRGVLPLRRTGRGTLETLDGRRTFDIDEVRSHFASRLRSGRISGPLFAEDLLEPLGDGPHPDDVKLFATHGEVLQVVLRRVPRHGEFRHNTSRYLCAQGEDLGAVAVGRANDESIEVPQALPEMVQATEHLSRAVGLPFVRVDMYATADGITLGELSRNPGGVRRLQADHDARLGEAWERAACRLELDRLAGRPPGVLYGHHPAPDPYPDGHVSGAQHAARTWAPTQVPCGTWC